MKDPGPLTRPSGTLSLREREIKIRSPGGCKRRFSVLSTIPLTPHRTVITIGWAEENGSTEVVEKTKTAVRETRKKRRFVQRFIPGDRLQGILYKERKRK